MCLPRVHGLSYFSPPSSVVQIFLSPTFVEVSENFGNVTITVEKRGVTERITNIVLNTNRSTATGLSVCIPAYKIHHLHSLFAHFVGLGFVVYH